MSIQLRKRPLAVGLVLALSGWALAQSLPSDAAKPDGKSTEQPRAAAGAPDERAVATPSRLLAGVHRLSDETIAALVTLSQDRALIERLARAPGTAGTLPLPEALHAAAKHLASQPEILTAAAALPEALASLRALYDELPSGAAARLDELRRGYERAEVQAGGAWQRLLEGDAAAQAQYREFMTRFSNAQRAMNPQFPCVQVMAPSYYFACPPDAAFVAFVLQSSSPPGELLAVLEKFWQEQDPALRDERVQRGLPAEPNEAAARFVAALSPAERATMFKPTSQPDPGALGLMPAFMQPVADQTLEVRRLTAAGEMLRLWSDPGANQGDQPAIAGNGPDAAGLATAGGGAVAAQGMTPAPYPPDFAAPTGYYAPGYVGLSSDYYWGSAVYYPFGYSRYSSFCGPVFFSHRDVDCDRDYWINYGYPYGDHGGFVNGRYVGPCEPFDDRPDRRGRAGHGDRAWRDVTGTNVGAVRHYPSAVRSLGGRGFGEPAAERVTPAVRRAPANRPSGNLDRIQTRRDHSGVNRSATPAGGRLNAPRSERPASRAGIRAAGSREPRSSFAPSRNGARQAPWAGDRVQPRNSSGRVQHAATSSSRAQIRSAPSPRRSAAPAPRNTAAQRTGRGAPRR